MTETIESTLECRFCPFIEYNDGWYCSMLKSHIDPVRPKYKCVMTCEVTWA